MELNWIEPAVKPKNFNEEDFVAVITEFLRVPLNDKMTIVMETGSRTIKVTDGETTHVIQLARKSVTHHSEKAGTARSAYPDEQFKAINIWADYDQELEDAIELRRDKVLTSAFNLARSLDRTPISLMDSVDWVYGFGPAKRAALKAHYVVICKSDRITTKTPINELGLSKNILFILYQKDIGTFGQLIFNWHTLKYSTDLSPYSRDQVEALISQYI